MRRRLSALARPSTSTPIGADLRLASPREFISSLLRLQILEVSSPKDLTARATCDQRTHHTLANNFFGRPPPHLRLAQQVKHRIRTPIGIVLEAI
jgi:hypothetical protein